MFYIGNHTYGLKRYFIRLINPECFVQPDIMFAPSEKVKKYFISAFACNNVKITGYPRNDVIFEKDLCQKLFSLEKNIIKENSKKRILLYVPTFRDTDRYSRKLL